MKKKNGCPDDDNDRLVDHARQPHVYACIFTYYTYYKYNYVRRIYIFH